MASCGVCFDEAPELALRGDRLLSLPCTHQFCGRCLDDWTDSYNKKKKKNNNNNNNDNNNNNNNDLPGKRSDVQGEAPCPQCRMVFDRQVVEDLSRPLGVVDYVIIPVMLGVLVFQQTFKFLMDLPSKVARAFERGFHLITQISIYWGQFVHFIQRKWTQLCQTSHNFYLQTKQSCYRCCIQIKTTIANSSAYEWICDAFNFCVTQIRVGWRRSMANFLLFRDRLVAAWKRFVSALERGSIYCCNRIHTSWNWVVSTIERVWNVCLTYVVAGWKRVVDRWNRVVGVVGRRLKLWWDNVVVISRRSWGSVRDGFLSCWRRVVVAWNAYWNRVVDAWQRVVSFVERVWNACKNRVVAGWKRGVDSWNRVMEAIERRLKFWWDNVVNFLKRSWAMLKGGISSRWARIVAAWNRFVSAIDRVWNACWNRVVDTWKRVVSFVERVWNVCKNRVVAGWKRGVDSWDRAVAAVNRQINLWWDRVVLAYERCKASVMGGIISCRGKIVAAWNRLVLAMKRAWVVCWRRAFACRDRVISIWNRVVTRAIRSYLLWQDRFDSAYKWCRTYLSNVFNAHWDRLAAVWKGFSDRWNRFVASCNGRFGHLLTLFTQLISSIRNAFLAHWRNVVAFGKRAIENAKVRIANAKGQMDLFWAFVKRHILVYWGRFIGAWDGILVSLERVVTRCSNQIAAAWNRLDEAFKRGWDRVAGISQEYAAYIKGRFAVYWGYVVNRWTLAVNATKRSLRLWKGRVVALFKRYLTSMKRGVLVQWDRVISFVCPIYNKFLDLVRMSIDFVETNFARLVHFFDRIVMFMLEKTQFGLEWVGKKVNNGVAAVRWGVWDLGNCAEDLMTRLGWWVLAPFTISWGELIWGGLKKGYGLVRPLVVLPLQRWGRRVYRGLSEKCDVCRRGYRKTVFYSLERGARFLCFTCFVDQFVGRCAKCHRGWGKIGSLCFTCCTDRFLSRCSDCQRGWQKLWGGLCFSCFFNRFTFPCSQCNKGYCKFPSSRLCFTCTIDSLGFARCIVCKGGWGKLRRLCFTCFIDLYFHRCSLCHRGWGKLSGLCFSCFTNRLSSLCAICHRGYCKFPSTGMCFSCTIDRLHRRCFICKEGWGKIGGRCLSCFFGRICGVCKRGFVKIPSQGVCFTCFLDRYSQRCGLCKEGYRKIGALCFTCFFSQTCNVCRVGYVKIHSQRLCFTCFINTRFCRPCVVCKKGYQKVGAQCFNCFLRGRFPMFFEAKGREVGKGNGGGGKKGE